MRQVILTLLVVIISLLPLKAHAGEAVWNPSGTIGAYVDLVDEQGGSKSVYFYEEENGNRYRGTYYALGYLVRFHDYNWALGTHVEVYEWLDDDTVLVGASFGSDDFHYATAIYEISTDGETTFIEFEDLLDDSGNRCEFYDQLLDQETETVWDLLDESLEIESYLADLCSDGADLIDLSEFIPDGMMNEYLNFLGGTETDYFFNCSSLPVNSIVQAQFDANLICVNVGYSQFIFTRDQSGKVKLLEFHPVLLD